MLNQILPSPNVTSSPCIYLQIPYVTRKKPTFLLSRDNFCQLTIKTKLLTLLIKKKDALLRLFSSFKEFSFSIYGKKTERMVAIDRRWIFTMYFIQRSLKGMDRWMASFYTLWIMPVK